MNFPSRVPMIVVFISAVLAGGFMLLAQVQSGKASDAYQEFLYEQLQLTEAAVTQVVRPDDSGAAISRDQAFRSAERAWENVGKAQRGSSWWLTLAFVFLLVNSVAEAWEAGAFRRAGRREAARE